jgi:hypothetical protein
MSIEEMNRHEHRYRWTGWALIVVSGLWIGTILLALALPARLGRTGLMSAIFFECIFPILFVLGVVLGVMRMVSYVRWTGRYPYYFYLVNRIDRSTHRTNETRGPSDDLSAQPLLNGGSRQDRRARLAQSHAMR